VGLCVAGSVSLWLESRCGRIPGKKSIVAVSLSIFIELLDEGETGGTDRDVPRVCRSVVSLGSPALCLRTLGLCGP
jgi:hypothetical protein